MRNVARVLGLLVAGSIALTGCAPTPTSEAETIVVWTTEDVQERLDRFIATTEAFTAETGVAVDVVAIAEDQFDQVFTAAAAEGDLPDVVAALSLAGAQSMNNNGLLNTEMSEQVVDELGTSTFSAGALELTQSGGAQLGVPSDAWVQLLLYRKDLFEAAGLEAPTTWEAIETAASSLNSSSIAGITAATTAGDGFTQQTFEYLALPGDCEMIGTDGSVALDSKECVSAFEFYNNLISEGSIEGTQDVDTTRATYFAGEAAMVVWSSFILDELAGLRNDALPTCKECATDSGWLAKNTGIVGALTGPNGTSAQFGEVVSWAPTVDATPATAEFIKYMMEPGYLDWLGLAPEGKVPVRLGNSNNASEYIDAWGSLNAGVDTKAPLSNFYSLEILNGIVNGTASMARWGIPQGQGALVGATLGELPVPKALNEMVTSGLTPAKAAEQAKRSVDEIAKSLNQ